MVRTELARHILTLQNVSESYLLDLLGPLLPLFLVLWVFDERTEKFVVGHGPLIWLRLASLHYFTSISVNYLVVRIVLMVLWLDPRRSLLTRVDQVDVLLNEVLPAEALRCIVVAHPIDN